MRRLPRRKILRAATKAVAPCWRISVERMLGIELFQIEAARVPTR